MKRFVKQAVIIFSLLAIVFYWVHNQEEYTNYEPPVEASFINLDRGFPKCTPPIFVFSIEDSSKQVAPLFDNLGNYSYKVSTKSERAQAFFNQGLRLIYAFNHAEAHRSFLEASRLDPSLAIAHWGMALALGPNINDPFPDEERSKNASESIDRALSLIGNSSESEKSLINALSNRHQEMDQDDLNRYYMEGMTEVVKKYPRDADIQTIYAASVMNTMPWNYWDAEGNPNPGISEAKAALEKAIEMVPNHPGAHHYYIHMVELPKPDLGVPSADALGGLMPGAGHLVHMPSHIYIRVGRYEDAIDANVKAIEADEDYISQCLSQGVYPLGYYPHNIHFLWSAASFIGQSELAIDAAEKTADKSPLDQLVAFPPLQDFVSTPLLAYTRFGKWNEILTTPYPGAEYKHLVLIWHYARGVAHLRKGSIIDAKEELDALKVFSTDKDLESLIANYTNPSSSVIKVAIKVLEGEIAAAKGNIDEAVELLNEGIVSEDALVYSEPAAWHIPVRQTLGEILVKANKLDLAEKVYLEDLKKNRENGWSLQGLINVYQRKGDKESEGNLRERFNKVWGKADIEISGSVM